MCVFIHACAAQVISLVCQENNSLFPSLDDITIIRWSSAHSRDQLQSKQLWTPPWRCFFDFPCVYFYFCFGDVFQNWELILLMPADSHPEVHWRAQQRNGSAEWNVSSIRKWDLVLCVSLLEFACVSLSSFRLNWLWALSLCSIQDLRGWVLPNAPSEIKISEYRFILKRPNSSVSFIHWPISWQV